MSDKSISSVALLDLKRQYANIKSEIEKEVLAVCESQHFIMGPKVSAFETEVAEYCQVNNAIGVTSGSDALLIALMALEVGEGDEVLTSPFTFFATGGAIARVGARPVYCDIDMDTYNLGPDHVQKFIDEQCSFDDGRLVNKKTGGIVKSMVPVHLFGQTADMVSLMEIAKKYNLSVIEDAAQAIGSEVNNGKRAGTMGDIGCFSFFPSKNLGAFGDAGMVVTQDEALAERLRILRLHGSKPKYYHAHIGGNFRLDAIQAAVLSVKLRYLDSWTEARQKHADIYRDLLAPSAKHLTMPHVVPGGRHIYNQFTIALEARDELKQHLQDQKIGCEIYYPVPLHIQECFEYLGYKNGDIPNSEKAASSVISIPVYPEMEPAEQEHVAKTINAFCSAGA